jgi:hypothetical protein
LSAKKIPGAKGSAGEGGEGVQESGGGGGEVAADEGGGEKLEKRDEAGRVGAGVEAVLEGVAGAAALAIG